MKVHLTPEAGADLAEAADWYAEHGSALARRFLAATRATLEAIRLQPFGHTEVRPDVRRAFIRRFPYGIYYSTVVEPSVITVIACVHVARDPAVLDRRWGST